MIGDAEEALARARMVRLAVFDVDGVLTDGRLFSAPTVRKSRPSIPSTATA